MRSQIIVLMFLLAANCQEEIDIEKALDGAIKNAKVEAKKIEDTDKQKLKEGVDKENQQNTNDQLALFAAPQEEIKSLAKAASIELAVLKELISIENIDTYRLKANKRYLRIWKRKFQQYCPTTYLGATCNPDAYYRTANGACNNLANPTWGALLCPQARAIPPMYDDGIGAPRTRDRLGLPLPSARVISNGLHQVAGESPMNDKRTMMVMQWGQFIDHEFISTPTLKGEMGATVECCGEDNADRQQCFPISIPDDDPFFNTSCMGLVRSAPVLNHDCSPGFREQLNQVTSFIDGSAIYGSKLEDTMKLRLKKGGLLRTLDHVTAGGGMLPRDSNNKCRLDVNKDFCQLAGDARVNVVPSLGWSHTNMMREHNRIATRLAKLNPHWNDETIFQQGRRIIVAIQQIINYNEYLPAILNKETMKKYKLTLKKKVLYSKGYTETINPTILNVFGVAAFRFGHSQIGDYQALMNKQYTFTEKKPIEETYHRPHMIIADNGKGLDGMARWLTADPIPLADAVFGDGVRNKLFLDKAGHSLDLPALNIQRGRDHGIPGYNHWRVHCKLGAAKMSNGGDFILPDHTQNAIHKLEDIYRHVDDIDLFPGAMTETLLPDSSVGPTFACLLGHQFRKLKKGDRYWHETSDRIIRFTKDQLRELRKASLARVICDNFKIDQLQPNVFLVPGTGNERVDCDKLPEVDLTKWTACDTPVVGGIPTFSGKCLKWWTGY